MAAMSAQGITSLETGSLHRLANDLEIAHDRVLSHPLRLERVPVGRVGADPADGISDVRSRTRSRVTTAWPRAQSHREGTG